MIGLGFGKNILESERETMFVVVDQSFADQFATEVVSVVGKL